MTKTLRKKIAIILVFSLCFGIFAGTTKAEAAETASYSYSYSYDKVDHRTIEYDDGIVTLKVGAKTYTLCVRDYAAEGYVFCDQYGTVFCVTQGGHLAWANPEIQFGMTSFVNWHISGKAVKATSLQCMGSSKNVATHYYDNYLVLHELPSFRELYYSVYDKYPEEIPEPTVTPSAKPSEEPTATVTPSAKPSAEPTATVTPSAKPSEEPTATVTPSAKPSEEPTATVTPSVEPSGEPTATVTPSAKPSEEPTATVQPTVPPVCNCVNGGPCIGPNGACVCINCPYKDKACNPTATATAVTTTSSSSSYKKVKPKVYYTSTMVGKRLKLWKVTQSVKNGKIKTSRKLMSICIFDKKKGTINWNGYRRKGVKTCQFTKKSRWLVVITKRLKMIFYPSGKKTKNPKTQKGRFTSIKDTIGEGPVNVAVKKKGGIVKLDY